METLQALDLYAQLEGLGNIGDLRSPDRLDEALRRLRLGIEDSLSRPSRLFGRHVEAMFEALVASLGAVDLLKAEDSGDCYARTAVQPPDFRIVTTAGRHLLVEVKSVAPGAFVRGFRVRPRDLEALAEYARLAGGELLFALYWSDLNAWSLIPPSAFTLERGKMHVSANDAFRASQMVSLGDVMLGTTPPLTWRLKAERPVKVDETSQQVQFTIGGTELLSGSKRITVAIEKHIAWFFMLNGEWEDEEVPEIKKNHLIGLRFEFRPIEPPRKQGFAIVGTLSSMFSGQYLRATTGESGVAEIRAAIRPGKLGSLVPETYKGKALPLWRIKVQPNAPVKREA